MFISYENDDIRECCLLLRQTSLISTFSSDEIKEIRAIIADLKATPKLKDLPLKFILDSENKTLEIEYSSFKIISKVITRHDVPAENQIDRIKIIKIFNIDLQKDSMKKHNYR
jgi:hypothetical protein